MIPVSILYTYLIENTYIFCYVLLTAISSGLSAMFHEFVIEPFRELSCRFPSSVYQAPYGYSYDTAEYVNRINCGNYSYESDDLGYILEQAINKVNKLEKNGPDPNIDYKFLKDNYYQRINL